MDVALQRLLLGRDGRSHLLTGLRGVGKTVLLNEFEQLAQGRGYFHEHVEVKEDGDLPLRLASAFRRVLLSMDAQRRIGERIRRALGVLKAFSIRLPDGPELSIDVDAVYGPADSGDLATDLAGLFIELGEVARDHDTGVLLTIDELHYVTAATLEALVMGLHRAAQLRLPDHRSPELGSRPWPPSPARPSPTPSGCSPSRSSAPSPTPRPAKPSRCPPKTRGSLE